MDYEKYLKEVINLAKQLQTKNTNNIYPPEINSDGKRAIYDNFSQDIYWIARLDETIKTYKPDGYIGNKMKERELKRVIKPLTDEKDLDINELFELIKLQEDYQ